ncbi:MAG: M48 family metalloprotease [Devosia sp.]|uniref:M48 family metalloprotease n=1 Tax=Devosia sp. TaxID=1871048 RepID=UPI001AD1039C|nr:M48 family metalloprotease [Devosia sp.]MBN9315106.1 M48 family metalloprotease [Devosia sp.]
MSMASGIKALAALLAAALMVLLAACSSLPGVAPSHPADTIPIAQAPSDDPEEDAIGAREHPRIVASYGGIYSDRQAEIMIARIVGRLLAAADQPNQKFTVTILDTAEVNAFALPGGYVYVTRGILALASDTSEIAAVLAHEIAHVTLKHARARTNRAKTDEIVDKVISGVFGADTATDQASNRSKMSLAAFSQQQELAADKEGILTSGRAGYDPHAAARFLGAMGRFAHFSQGDADQEGDFLSSHPSTPDRIQKAIETARSFFGAPGLGETDREGYMAGIEGLAFGDSPAQGAISGRRYINPTLKFTFEVPQTYTLQISKGAVVGVAGEGEAVRFDSAEVPATMGLEDYLKSGWIAGLQPQTVRRESANGYDMATGTAVTPQWNFRVAVVRHEGRVYRFIFASRFDNAGFAKAAEATLRSFRAATAKDLALVKQLVVRSVTAGPLDTADSLARRMSGLGRGTDLFYILNNLYPGDTLITGQRYKIVTVE